MVHTEKSAAAGFSVCTFGIVRKGDLCYSGTYDHDTRNNNG